MNIHVDPEFASLIPPVPADQEHELEQAILADGQVIEPLVLWKHRNTLLDGHRRHKLKGKHPRLKMPKAIVLDLPDRQAATNWIIDHQLSKRNISVEQRRYLIGKRYNVTKKPPGRPADDNSATVAELNSQKIAEKEGVSIRSLRNNADFAEALDATPKQVKEAVLAGEVKATTKDLESLAELPKREANKVAKTLATGEIKSLKIALETLEPKENEEVEEQIDPDSLEAVQAELREWEKQVRAVARQGRKILGAEGNEVTRPWCGRYAILTLIQPLHHVARTILNDLPIGGKPDKPKLHREQIAEDSE